MSEQGDLAMLNVSHTLLGLAIAYYLIDTIADPVERQRVAAQRFGKAIASLILDSTPQPPAATGDTTPTNTP